MLDLFVGFAQSSVHAIALGEENVSRSDDYGEQRSIEEEPAVAVRVGQPPNVDRADASDGEQADHGGFLGLHGKRQHGGGEDEESAGAGIGALEQNPQQHHAGNVDETERILNPEDTEIENEKYRGAEGVEEPHLRASVAQNWIDEEEAQIEDPEQRAPSVIFIFEYGAPRLQFPGTAFVAAEFSL